MWHVGLLHLPPHREVNTLFPHDPIERIQKKISIMLPGAFLFALRYITPCFFREGKDSFFQHPQQRMRVHVFAMPGGETTRSCSSSPSGTQKSSESEDYLFQHTLHSINSKHILGLVFYNIIYNIINGHLINHMPSRVEGAQILDALVGFRPRRASVPGVWDFNLSHASLNRLTLYRSVDSSNAVDGTVWTGIYVCKGFNV